MRTSAVRQLIDRRYVKVHGASPATGYGHFCVVEAGSDLAPSAALGFRMASDERLFLEDYLDDPIEQIVGSAFGKTFQRDRIVEIGAHASERSRATIALWARTARHLDGMADVAVAVLTAPLRSMFDRLGIAVVDIGDADPARLSNRGAAWGDYYALSPRVCAGLIAPARPKLARFDDGLTAMCA